MPIQEIGKVEQREEIARMALDGRFTVKEVAERHGVSRPTVRLWRDRFVEEGRAGLEDRSRAPNNCPHRTPEWIVERVIEERRALEFGSKKILRRLEDEYPGEQLPSRVTIDTILKRNGLVKTPRKRVKRATPFARRYPTNESGELNTIDFKGEFLMGNGRYCYPLTMVEPVSRYVLACEALASTELGGAWKVIVRVFREHGLPKAMLSDNGPPFGAAGHARLSSLSVRLMKLGIQPVFIDPGCPQQNGSHERMHRDLKQRATRPPEGTLGKQQVRFNEFIKLYNELRPHEGIDMDRPAHRFKPSPRPYPNHILSPEYPSHFEVRRVSSSGTIKWKGQRLFVGHPLRHELIGFEPSGEALWTVQFYGFMIAKLDERTGELL